MNNHIKNFLNGGLFGIILLIIYGFLAYLSSYFLGIISLGIIWLPYVPMIVIFGDFFDNINFIIFLSALFYFIIGGLLNLLRIFIKNRK